MRNFFVIASVLFVGCNSNVATETASLPDGKQVADSIAEAALYPECKDVIKVYQTAKNQLETSRVNYERSDKEYSKSLTLAKSAAEQVRNSTLKSFIHNKFKSLKVVCGPDVQSIYDSISGYEDDREALRKFNLARNVAANNLTKNKTKYDEVSTKFDDAWLRKNHCIEVAKETRRSRQNQASQSNSSNVNSGQVSSGTQQRSGGSGSVDSGAATPTRIECTSNESEFRYTHEVSDKGVILRNTPELGDNLAAGINVVPCLRVALFCNNGFFMRNNGFIKLSFLYDENGKRSAFIGKYIYAGQLSPTPNPECLKEN